MSMVVRSTVTIWFLIVVASVTLAISVATGVAGAGDSMTGRTLRALGMGVALVAWLLCVDRLAASGVLLDFSGSPPRFSRLVLTVLLGALAIGLSPAGARAAQRLPYAALIGFQAFRVPVELVLHELHREGAVPIQMTFEGLNFDVVTGVSAVVVGALAARRPLPSRVIWAWNTGGLGLLASIVVVANLSTPAFHVFTGAAPTTILGTRPFVWLPTLLVPAALLGHVLVYRRLRWEARGERPRSPSPR